MRLLRTMRRLFAALFLFVGFQVAAGQTTNPKDSQTPWHVFTDSAPVLAAPDRNAQPVSTLKHDDLVSGTLIVDSDSNDEWLEFSRNRETLFVSRTNLTRPHPANLKKGNLPYGTEVVNRWWGIPISYEPNDLVVIPAKYTTDKDGYRLRKEACDQLVKMFEAAEKEGVKIRVASAYRSGEMQVRIYTRNTRRDPSQRSSAPPGHSEHQLGTTVDLSDFEGKHSIRTSFETTKESAWMEKNAAKFGYVRTYYPDNVKETGYISEPWHWRYFGQKIALQKAAARKAGEGKQAVH